MITQLASESRTSLDCLARVRTIVLLCESAMDMPRTAQRDRHQGLKSQSREVLQGRARVLPHLRMTSRERSRSTEHDHKLYTQAVHRQHCQIISQLHDSALTLVMLLVLACNLLVGWHCLVPSLDASFDGFEPLQSFGMLVC